MPWISPNAQRQRAPITGAGGGPTDPTMPSGMPTQAPPGRPQFGTGGVGGSPQGGAPMPKPGFPKAFAGNPALDTSK